METDQLEKQVSFWNRLLYAMLGASVVLLISTMDQLLGLIWFMLELVVTSTAFFLLWGKRWKRLPPSKERTNTIFGYFLASWLLSLFPGFLGADPFYYIIVFGYAVFILVIYRRHQKALAVSDEMFP
jgi:sterol desaturase/sphingolipid hydroxylase (fatty acid hydroxylase superfamily)